MRLPSALIPILFLAILGVPADLALAQQYPAKPVRIIVPFPPGGGVDTVARAVGQKLTEIWKHQVVVENRAGAGGNIAADVVAKAPPDGYTFLVTVASFSISPSLYRKLPFDPVKDFVAVTQLTSSYTMLVASPRFEAKSFKELVALAKAKPGVINYGSSGIGAPLHLVMEIIKNRAGIDIEHIPYKGDAELTPALLNGEVQLAVMPVASVQQPIKDGRMIALGISSLTRAPTLPDVPTLDEAGLRGFQYVSWMGIFAPAATPPDIVNQVQQDVAKALAAPDMQERLTSWGYEPVGSTPQQFAARFRADIAVNAKAIKDANVPIQD